MKSEAWTHYGSDGKGYVSEAPELNWRPGAGPRDVRCPASACTEVVPSILFDRHMALGSITHWTATCRCGAHLMVLNGYQGMRKHPIARRVLLVDHGGARGFVLMLESHLGHTLTRQLTATQADEIVRRLLAIVAAETRTLGGPR